MASRVQLIDDLIYDVFRQFIAIDVDGPFTLIQLSTQWRDAILANSHMWTWITIDYSFPDIEQRIQIASQLSAGFPLQITIKIPSLKLSDLQNLLPRCRFLFIDQYKPHEWETKQYAQESKHCIQDINQMLLDSPPPILKQIYWSIEGVRTPFLSRPLHDFLGRDHVVDLRALFGAFPTEMISYLHLDDISVFQPRKNATSIASMDSHLLWETLGYLDHLTSLEIVTSSVLQEKRRSIGHLNLPQLRNLTLQFIARQTVLSSVFDILSNLQAPNIHTVHLIGPVTDRIIWNAISNMSHSIQPIHLELDLEDVFFTDEYNWADDSALQLPYSLNCLKTLKVMVRRGDYHETVVFPVMVQINLMTMAAPRLQFLTLDFEKHWIAFLSLLNPVSCLVEISLLWKDDGYAGTEAIDNNYIMRYPARSTRQEPAYHDVTRFMYGGGEILKEVNHRHYITFPDSMEKVIQERAVAQGQNIQRHKLRISKLTLYIRSEQLDVCFGALGIEATEVGRLIIRRSEIDFTLSPRTGLPDPWMQSLQELDIQGVTFIQDFEPLLLPLHRVQGIHLPNLTVLRCPPSVALHLLENHFVPRLRDLTLSVFEEAQSEVQIAWGDLVTVFTTNNFARSLQLITLGLDFYPDWNSLLQVIKLYVKGETNEQSLRCLKLPGMPHPSILEELVYALRGKKTTDGSRASGLDEVSSSFNKFDRWGCVYCGRSGWVCYQNVLMGPCWRHTPEKLVTITTDTL